MASIKAKNAMPKEIQKIKDNPWMPKYNGSDYPVDDFFIVILYPITELPESKEEEELLTKDILFQEPNQTTEIKQYLMYSDLSKKLELNSTVITMKEYAQKKHMQPIQSQRRTERYNSV
ncbi:hypothetical protein G9A89_008315 [Geosiphon pyriformis]|nr:hypothetical protein G9A89_008315 [Geosiphon pyriformis]